MSFADPKPVLSFVSIIRTSRSSGSEVSALMNLKATDDRRNLYSLLESSGDLPIITRY